MPRALPRSAEGGVSRCRVAYSSKFLAHLSKTSALLGRYELASVLGVSKAAGAQRASGETTGALSSSSTSACSARVGRHGCWGRPRAGPIFYLMIASWAALVGKLVVPCLPRAVP